MRTVTQSKPYDYVHIYAKSRIYATREHKLLTDDAYLCLITRMNETHSKHDWEVAAKGLLKSEMIHREFDYSRLSSRMKQLGLQNVSANNLKSKINRGTFSAAFFIQALIAMGCEEINIKNLPIRKKLTPPSNHNDSKHHSTSNE